MIMVITLIQIGVETVSPYYRICPELILPTFFADVEQQNNRYVPPARRQRLDDVPEGATANDFSQGGGYDGRRGGGGYPSNQNNMRKSQSFAGGVQGFENQQQQPPQQQWNNSSYGNQRGGSRGGYDRGGRGGGPRGRGRYDSFKKSGVETYFL